MMTSMQSLTGLKSGSDLEKIYAFYKKYFFNQAQEYFPSNAFNADARISYENGKLAYIAGTYSNDTDPITQSLGDHYVAEQRWVTKRILYMMSKYSFGLFSANGSDTITVRAAGNTIKYELTPAMDMYPAIANGTSIIKGARTKAGEVCVMEIELSGSGDQQNAIQGASYLQDIGDWHNKNVQGSMIIQGRMLRDIRLGSKTEPIVISITSLTLSNCTSLQRLLLSNISTLAGTLNLSGCTHLQEVHADGTSLVQIILPKGGGLRTVEFSAYNQYLSLMNYPLMTNEGVGVALCKGIVTDFFITGCPMIKPMQLLVDMMDAQLEQGDQHRLKRIRAVGFNETYNDSSVLDKLAILADGTYEGLSAEGIAGEDELPVLDGALNVYANAYEDSIETLRSTFSKLTLNVIGEYYIRFKDPIVGSYMIGKYGDGAGITKNQMAGISFTQFGRPFKGNTDITFFDEFQYLTSYTEAKTELFSDCSNLKSIVLPKSLTTLNHSAFKGCDLRSFVLSKNITFISQAVFQNNTNLTNFIFEERTEPLNLRWNIWAGCTSLKEISLPDVAILDGNSGGMFDGCTSLEKVHISEGFNMIGDYSFRNCILLTEVNIPSNITKIGRGAFQKSGIEHIVLPDKPGIIIDGGAFDQCSNLKEIFIPEGYDISIASGLLSSCEALIEVTIGEGVTTIPSSCFNRCIALKKVILPSTISMIQTNILFNDYSMETLVVKAIAPPTVEGSDFGYNFSKICKIYVPDTSVSTYKNNSWWSQYASRIYPLSTLPKE